MGKLLVMSILMATVVLPLHYARDERRARGLRRLTRAFLVYCVVWVVAVLFVAPRV